MKRRCLAFAFALLALLLPASALAAAPGPKPPLSADGYFFTDASGRAVFMHGFNMVYKVGSYAPSDFGFGADDAKFLNRHGFNTIRLGIIYKGLEPNAPGADGQPIYEDGYLDKIAKTEKVLAKHKIYSLLDFHQDLYNERFQGEGWPDWQTFDDGAPAEPQQGFPGNYLFMPAVSAAFDNFWENAPAQSVGLQDRYAMAWRHVAERFRENPYVMGYDLMNEPWPGSVWPSCVSTAGCPAFDEGPLTEFSKRTIAAIREVDDESLVFWEPLLTFDFGAATSHGDTGDENAGFSFHDYCIAGALASVGLPLSAFGVPEGTGCDTLEELPFQNAQGVSERTGDVPFLTEFSATDDAETNERMLRLSDQYMVSWQSWHYCDCDDPTTAGPGIQSLVIDPRKPPKGDNLKREKLEIFSRPYPRAIAGTPTGFDFDPESREFNLGYRTNAVGGGKLGKRAQTEVFIPPIHYHGDYEVGVEGAKVVSKPGKRVLRLRNAPGAPEVSVRVKPV